QSVAGGRVGEVHRSARRRVSSSTIAPGRIRMRNNHTVAIVLVLAAVFVSGQAGAPGAPPAGPDGLSSEEKRDIEVFRRVQPAVAFIASIALRRDFFSLDIHEIPQGAGSGFVWDKQGHIVTNFHVVQPGDRFAVTLADHSEWEGTVVGAAADKDLAI